MSNFCVATQHYRCDFTKTRVRVNNYIWEKVTLIYAIMNIDREKGLEVSSSNYDLCRDRLLKLLLEKKYDNVEIIQ